MCRQVLRESIPPTTISVKTENGAFFDYDKSSIEISGVSVKITLDDYIQIGAHVFLCDNCKSYYRYIGVVSSILILRPWTDPMMPAKFKLFMRRCSIAFDNEIVLHYGQYYKRCHAFKQLRLNEPRGQAFQQHLNIMNRPVPDLV